MKYTYAVALQNIGSSLSIPLLSMIREQYEAISRINIISVCLRNREMFLKCPGGLKQIAVSVPLVLLLNVFSLQVQWMRKTVLLVFLHQMFIKFR